MKTAHVLIYEPSKGGHQMVHIRYLIAGIIKSVPKVRFTLLMTADAAAHPSAQEVIDDFAETVTPELTPEVTNGNYILRTISPYYEYQWRNAEAFARAIELIGPGSIDFIIVPYLETLGLLTLGLKPRLFAGRPWATITHSTRFHFRRSAIPASFQFTDVIQELFFRRVLANPDLTCVATLDPYLAQAAKNERVIYCPNPPSNWDSPARQDARAFYRLRPETVVVAVFGLIDRRKELGVLFEGAARLPSDLDLTILLAGQQKPDEVAAVLQSPAAQELRKHGRLVELNRYIVPGRDPHPLQVADVSWVFYEEKFVFASGVMIDSCIYRRPVIARKWGLLGRLVEDIGCGLALTSGEPDEIGAAMIRLARNPDLRAEMGAKGAAAVAANTPENFARPIVDALNRTLVKRSGTLACSFSA